MMILEAFAASLQQTLRAACLPTCSVSLSGRKLKSDQRHPAIHREGDDDFTMVTFSKFVIHGNQGYSPRPALAQKYA